MLTPSRKVAVACGAAAVAACGVAVFAVLSTPGWRLSTLVRMSRPEPIAALARKADPNFSFVDRQAHYDGVYFYAMALDPFGRGEAHTLIDRPAYRYGHVGYSWLAGIASFGRASALPAALLGVGLLAAGVAGFAASLLATELGLSGWFGLAVALSPGIVFAITADTSEPVGLALTLLGLLWWIRGRWIFGAVALAAACMTKEPLAVVPAGLAIWELLERARGRGSQCLVGRLGALAAGPALLLGWFVYLRATFGLWPFQQQPNVLTFPFAGWLNSIRRAAALATGSYYRMQVGNAAISLLAVVGAALLIGICFSRRLRTPVEPVFILSAILISSLTWLGAMHPKDLFREAAVTMVLLPLAIAGRHTPTVEDTTDAT